MSTKEEELQHLRTLIETFENDIPLFAKYVFDAELTPKQAEFCHAWNTKRQITFRGGTSLGKTFVEAIVFFHSLVCYDHVQVTVVGPSEPQIKSGIWLQIQQLHNRMNPHFKDSFEVSSTRVTRKSNPANCFGEYRLASVGNPDSLRGAHAYHNHWICDEASGIPDEAFRGAILNALSDPEGKVALISNPSRASGFFFQTFRDPDVAPDWTPVHGTLYDSPNYDPNNPESFNSLARSYGGPTSRDFRVMVNGDFPLQDESGLIPREHIDLAVDNENAIAPVNSPYCWGVDISGRGADSSVLVIRQDNVVHDIIEWSGFDTVQSAHKVADLYKRTSKDKRPAVISVDSNGLGYGFAADLKHMGLPVFECNTSRSPTRNPDRYFRLRDQVWVEMAEWFATENVRIPNHTKLIEELCVPNFDDTKGKIKVEGKPELKKKLGRSPDFADALSLTFGPSKMRYSGSNSWSKPIQYDHLQTLE